MEEFKLKKAFIVSKSLGALYPLIAMIGLLVIISSDVMELSEKGPFILAGLVGWFGFEVWRASTYFKYKVAVNDETIQINNDTAVAWNQIAKAKLNGLRFGMDPVMQLTTQDNRELKIPAAINGINYIRGFIEKHVSQIEREEA